MDLRFGFTIDVPPVTIPWNVGEGELQHRVRPVPRHVTAGYWTMPVTVFHGLSCMLGFHFDKPTKRLSWLEFFRDRDSYPGLRRSFDEFQSFFEREFGPASKQSAGSEGYPSCVWSVEGAEIAHYVFDRFGPEEHMEIRPVFPSNPRLSNRTARLPR